MSQPAHARIDVGERDPDSVVDALIRRARAAMEAFTDSDQAGVDEAVTALAWSLYKPENAEALAAMAVEDTGLGNAADKVVKNQRKTFGTLRDLHAGQDRRRDRGAIRNPRPGDLRRSRWAWSAAI